MPFHNKYTDVASFQYVCWYDNSANLLLRKSYHNDYIYRTSPLGVTQYVLQDQHFLRMPYYNAYPRVTSPHCL